MLPKTLINKQFCFYMFFRCLGYVIQGFRVFIAFIWDVNKAWFWSPLGGILGVRNIGQPNFYPVIVSTKWA